MRGSHGFRRRTRNLRITPRQRGKISISKYLRKFELGAKVYIDIDPRYINIPFPKFNGKIGEVVGSQGRSYFVSIDHNGKRKTVLVPPEHLNYVSIGNKNNIGNKNKI